MGGVGGEGGLKPILVEYASGLIHNDAMCEKNVCSRESVDARWVKPRKVQARRSPSGSKIEPDAGSR